MIRSVLSLSLSLLSCVGAEATPGRARSELPAEAGPLDALNRRHARLRQRMGHRGYGQEAGLSRAFVLEDRGVAWPLDLAVGTCSTFVALGGGAIRDLAFTLYDSEGEEAASDTVEAEGGLLHVCPRAEGVTQPYYLVLDAQEGAGAVMVAHFESQLGEGDGFDGLFEGVLAPRVPFRDVEEHLARSRTALRARGFEPVDAPLLARVTEGALVRQRVQMTGGRCYVAIGRSGEGLDDIDLFLFDSAGVEVARDLRADAEPSIEHCPEAPARATVELRAFEGAGAVGVMILEGPGPDTSEVVVEAASDAAHEESDSRAPELAVGVLGAPLLHRGFAAPLFVSREAAIVPGEVRTHDVVVGPGCALIAGAASDEGVDLDLYLAEEGREIDHDTAVQSTARVRACRDEPTVMRVAVKSYGRDGAYALALFRAPEAIDSLRGLRLEEAAAPYRQRAYTLRRRFAFSLDAGERARRVMQVERGRCVAVVVAGDDGIRDVDLFLRETDDELVASDSGPAPYAVVTHCAEEAPRNFTLEVSTARGGGSVVALVLDSGVEVESVGAEVGPGGDDGGDLAGARSAAPEAGPVEDGLAEPAEVVAGPGGDLGQE